MTGLSAPSRWILALVGVLSGASMLWLFIFQPMIETPPSGKLAAIGFAVFCFGISAACIPGPVQRPAFRFLGACVFLVYVVYAVDMLGKPLFPGGTYRRSDPSPINALLGLCLFGLPGAYVAVTGRFPGGSAAARDELDQGPHSSQDRFSNLPRKFTFDEPSPHRSGQPRPDDH